MSSSQQQSSSSPDRPALHTEGTDYATRRGFSIMLDDPLYEDALSANRVDSIRAAGSASGGGGGAWMGGRSMDHSQFVSSPRKTMASDFEGGVTPPEPSTMAEARGQAHLQSADLFDFFSPVQKERQRMKCVLSDRYQRDWGTTLHEISIPNLKRYMGDDLKAAHPRLFDQPAVEIQPILDEDHHRRFMSSRKALRVGLVLSGGPAPGGHNVIAGVYDYVKSISDSSQLLGFMGGLDGFFNKESKVVDDNMMNRFRNTGGFDMFWSGRGKVHEQDKDAAVEIVRALDLRGLIIVGGDGSNSNAALLAEYFAEHCPTCAVVGVPKTIDGDLKNAAIECSFGFDTAAKTYSELIGNLCTDVCAGQGVYHFVRVMGRSASHLVLECAMQTRPNLVLIGEEIKAKNISLAEIVGDIASMIIERAEKLKKNYGIILVPEGLIGFIPEMKVLMDELGRQPPVAVGTQFDPTQLSENSCKLWNFLPESIQDQLLGDREATGYVQEAKIATERLLILLVEKELQARGFNLDDLTRMHHYFGYEGRCAMPSNFDANYCYNLGYTAGCLIEHGKNGYMAVVRGLVQSASEWVPCGVPFPQLMTMIDLPANGGRIPGITRQLVDIESPGFQVFCEARKAWRLGDFYRCPGPIQFEGPAANISNFTIDVPSLSKLLAGANDQLWGENRAVVPKRLGNYSELQEERLKQRPKLPAVCKDHRARLTRSTQYLPKDPYVRRQILTYYPELARNNDFFLQEVRSESSLTEPAPPTRGNLRVGIAFLSRQSPGMLNIIWGLHERVRMRGGVCFGFRGVHGILTKSYIELRDDDLVPFKNMGGVDLIGRGTKHELLKRENQRQVLRTCREMKLDGLVLVGSSLGMTEAALLTEYFVEKVQPTCIIGVAATASNNVLHELIETNIGFDTASKLYASLIGNVLTDAASMPKYWHFVRLMGRQPSNEVLECALQTHPNVVIIAEEYGAGQKTLVDVVNDIADVVCRRAEGVKALTTKRRGERRCRNFGAVLIPDGLWHHLPTMRMLMKELDQLMQDAQAQGKLHELRAELLAESKSGQQSPITTTTGAAADACNAPGNASATNRSPEVGENGSNWLHRLTPWSAAVWRTLPYFIQKEFLQINPELRDASVETEVLLSQMVKQELLERAQKGLYQGTFQAVCHYFGYQGRSAMPSVFDSTLAFAHGHLAAMCIESNITGHLTNVRGLCGDVDDWKLTAVPFNCLLTLIPVQQDLQVHPYLNNSRKSSKQTDMPIIPNAEVNLQCRALRWMKVARPQWEDQDRFCNPGPIQFYGTASTFYHRILHEEQADYYTMLRHVQKFAYILKEACDFGVEESFLKAAYVGLNGLLTLRFHSDEVIGAMTPFPKLEDLEQNIDKNRYVAASRAKSGDSSEMDNAPLQNMRRAITLVDSQASAALRTGSQQHTGDRQDSGWHAMGRASQHLRGVTEEKDFESPPMVSANSDDPVKDDEVHHEVSFSDGLNRLT